MVIKSPVPQHITLYINRNGDKSWESDEEHHRANGPAIVRQDGVRRWYWHGMYCTPAEHAEFSASNKRVRLAVFTLGSKSWFYGGLLHRANGPACTKIAIHNFRPYRQEYWWFGKQITEYELLFINGKIDGNNT